MKPLLPIFIMIDACGWEIIKDDPFLRSMAPTRRRLRSVFGYSSACVPSIVSGRWPDEHRNWCYFVYDPSRSPFRFLRPLRWLPRSLTSRRIFRRWLSKAVRARGGFRGYFDLYNMPFEHIALFDFSEKKSPLRTRGMNRGDNIFDWLQDRRIPCFSSDPDADEESNLDHLLRAIEEGEIEFAFSYWPGLDGLLHSVGNRSPRIADQLRRYEEWIERVMLVASAHYEEVRLYVFSDHGMANCDEFLDLKGRIDALGMEFGNDYVAVYDSTMARFWFLRPRAESIIRAALGEVEQGGILDDAELRELRAFFPDRYFGELIFLVREGTLIVPSHMGERPIRAMHGYHPDEKHSYAALFTNRPSVSDDIESIPDIYKLMVREAIAASEHARAAAVALAK